jgi:hypothetical protein
MLAQIIAHSEMHVRAEHRRAGQVKVVKAFMIK